MADRQVRALRGRRREAAVRTIGELEDRGCEAAGYRLSGAVFDHVCCRHLYGQDRMLVAWPAVDHAIVVLVGRHDGSGSNVYAELLAALGITAPSAARDKPPCCDDEGDPPAHSGVAMDIAEAVERWARTRRRGR